MMEIRDGESHNKSSSESKGRRGSKRYSSEERGRSKGGLFGVFLGYFLPDVTAGEEGGECESVSGTC